MTDDRERRGRLTSAVATGKGDDGTTGLLFGARSGHQGRCAGRRLRNDRRGSRRAGPGPRTAVDPAPVRILNAGLGSLSELILRFQRELFVAASELATNPDARDRLVDGQTRVSAEMVEGVEAVLRETESRIVMPREFVVPGETTAAPLSSWRGPCSGAPSGGS